MSTPRKEKKKRLIIDMGLEHEKRKLKDYNFIRNNYN